jgi:hypothetical protein
MTHYGIEEVLSPITIDFSRDAGYLLRRFGIFSNRYI